MRPSSLHTRLFLDSGDPQETRDLLKNMGFLDGQTTNPTLIAKNPQAKTQFNSGKRFTKNEIFDFYRATVKEISELIPKGSVSIEVYSDHTTSGDAMLEQASEMATWIRNAHIKFPTTAGGLEAAEKAVHANIPVNMTLCFSQDQAAAVYAATRSSKKGDVFVSPFIGRLDDLGENGMDLIANILKMYEPSDHHVEVLTASVRSLEHFLEALRLKSDIITAPFAIYEQWIKEGMPLASANHPFKEPDLTPIIYKDLDLSANWRTFNITHDLTDKGIERFCADWNALLAN